MTAMLINGHFLLTHDQDHILAKYPGLERDLIAAGLRSEYYTYHIRESKNVPLTEFEKRRYKELEECPAVLDNQFQKMIGK